MSKELLTVILDTVVSLILYFCGKYLVPSIFEDVKFVIAILQPLVLVLIGLFAAQRIAAFVRGVVSDIKAAIRGLQGVISRRD